MLVRLNGSPSTSKRFPVPQKFSSNPLGSAPENGLLADLPDVAPEAVAREITGEPKIRTLLIEDGEIDAVVVRSNLEQKAAGGYCVFHATSLEEAHHQLLNDHTFDVIILDLNLPDSEGLATFESLFARHPAIPIVILTGQDDMETASTAVLHGAQDFVPKSQLTPETLTRSLQYAIERHTRRSVERENQRIQIELEAARNIQRMMLPQAPPSIPGLDVAAVCTPAEVCGGDFFDYFPASDGHWDFVIGDVSSHGFGPALITVGARRALRMSGRLHDDVGQVLTVANQGISEDTAGNHFMTLFYARLNTATRELSYSSAGHPVWVVTSQGDTISLQCEGLPMGILPDVPYETVERIQLAAGDILIMPTDGIYESMNPAGKQFGTVQMLELIRELRHQKTAEIRDKVIERIQQYCLPGGPHDDLTLMLAKAE